MVKVSLEVRYGAARFRVAVRADTISRAVSIMKARHPARDVRVVFPIDPEEFFAGVPEKTAENAAKNGNRMRLLPDRVC
jgi:hypothetical protein